MYVHAAAHSKAEAKCNSQQEEPPMNSATVTTETTVNPSIQNPKQQQQRQTAKDVIAANVQALIEQLEQGHSEGLTA